MKIINNVLGGVKVEKEIKCPWCQEMTTPGKEKSKSDFGTVIQRSCSQCKKILAAYLEQEGTFLPEIRKF